MVWVTQDHDASGEQRKSDRYRRTVAVRQLPVTLQVAFTYVLHDSAFVPIDTLRRPHDPNVRQTFEFRGAVVLELTAGGPSTNEIAEALGISVQTVEAPVPDLPQARSE